MQARPPTDIADQPSGVIQEKFKERGELEVEHRSGWFCLLTASKLSKVRIRCIFGKAFRDKGSSSASQLEVELDLIIMKHKFRPTTNQVTLLNCRPHLTL